MRLTMAQEYTRRRVQAMYGWQVAVPVPYDGIGMDGDAARQLRGAAERVAAEADVPVALVARRLFDYAYRLEPTGTLVLVVGVPERGVELFVEMGAQHWRPVQPGESGPRAGDADDAGDGEGAAPDAPATVVRDGANGLRVMNLADLLGGHGGPRS